jgi:3-hydroxymyristoyl/3-hydroxydecanoyl-(acyl carrier protein) dehydratase
MVPVGTFVVTADHPCMPGHFPGRPIVPGVVLLDQALALVLARFPGARLAGVPTCKFTTVVTPGQTVRVFSDPSPAPSHRVGFICSVEDATVARGIARLAGAAA